ELALRQGDFATTNALAAQGLALARARQEPHFVFRLLWVLGRAAYEQGELQHARKRLQEAVTFDPEHRHPFLATDLAEVLAGLGERDQAQALLAEKLSVFRSQGIHVSGLSHLLRNQGRIELQHGEWERAAAFYRESLCLLQDHAVREGVPDGLE